MGNNRNTNRYNRGANRTNTYDNRNNTAQKKQDREDTRLYLNFIENNITRMNQLSFRIKELSVTILTALLAAFVAIPGKDGTKNDFFLLIAIVPTFIFWMLDSFYLQQEWKFRGLYKDVIEGNNENLYSMDTSKYKGWNYSFFKSVASKTEWTIYLVVIILLLVARKVLM